MLVRKQTKRRKGKEVLGSREEEGERINKARERAIRRNWTERLDQEKDEEEVHERNSNKSEEVENTEFG